VIQADGSQDCGVDNTDGDNNQGKTDNKHHILKAWTLATYFPVFKLVSSDFGLGLLSGGFARDGAVMRPLASPMAELDSDPVSYVGLQLWTNCVGKRQKHAIIIVIPTK